MVPSRSLDLEQLRRALAAGRFEWRLHALERMAERNITLADALAVLQHGERIEDYPEDNPYPSALFLGWMVEKPLHVLAALDQEHDWAYIITVYEPDYRTRRSP